MIGPPNHSVRYYDYHAMHFGAKRGIEIACRPSAPSVCLSLCLCVTLVDQDHISWKSWKVIARQLSQHLRSS